MRRNIGSLWVVAGMACCTAVWAAEPDQPAGPGHKQVEIHVVIADVGAKDRPKESFSSEPADKVLALVRQLEEQGKLEACSRVRLTTLEGQSATAQFGERKALVTGRSRTSAARDQFGGGFPQQTSYTMENLGTLISATASVLDDGDILVQLQIERSRLAADAPVIAAANEPARPESDLPPPRTLTTSTRSTVRIADGQAVVLSGLVQGTPAKDVLATLIVVTAKVVSPHAPKTAAQSEQQSMQIYSLKFANAKDAASVLKSVFEGRPLRIAVDERTNRLVISGTADDLAAVQAVLLKLDEAAK